jgi:cytochrome c5
MAQVQTQRVSNPGIGSPLNFWVSNTFGHCALMLVALCVAGCDAHPARPLTAGELARLKPDDTHTAQLYEHSCKACHAQPGTGAPLVHDHAAWDPRWGKGIDTLTAHAVLGFQAMPAGGQCATCTPGDYQAIIRFMADRENGQ